MRRRDKQTSRWSPHRHLDKQHFQFPKIFPQNLGLPPKNLDYIKYATAYRTLFSGRESYTSAASVPYRPLKGVKDENNIANVTTVQYLDTGWNLSCLIIILHKRYIFKRNPMLNKVQQIIKYVVKNFQPIISVIFREWMIETTLHKKANYYIVSTN